MKNIKLLCMLISFLILTQANFATNWDKPDHGYFKLQNDIDQAVSGSSVAMATTYYQDTLFNFVNYNLGNKIILRKMYNTSNDKFSPKWGYKKFDGIKPLNDLSPHDYQPASVSYDEKLYVFALNKDDKLCYSVYTSYNNSWSSVKVISTDITGGMGYGISAFVHEDKLVIAYTTGGHHMHLLYTNDLDEDWTRFDLPETYVVNSKKPYISAITASWFEGSQDSKVMIGYIDKDQHAKCIELYCDDDDNFQIKTEQLISNVSDYNSIALSAGSVNGDSESSGRCVQAFLKKDDQDNLHTRYRIKRYEQINNNKWRKAENNMFKQNYGWASHGVNLTAVVYPYPDGEDMRQFMCLVYRGDNTTQHPLNCGWAETDRLVYNYADAESVVLSDDENTQYIGYIEGPPPFYANNAEELSGEAVYLRENKPISELEFSTSTGTSTEKETKFGFTAKIKVKLKKKFSASLEGAFARKNSSEYSTTIKNTMSVHSEEEAKGYFFVLRPVIIKTKYDVYDVNDNFLYQYIYYYMTKPQIDNETPELAEGLDSGDPGTFYHRGINFAAYQTKEIGASSVSCNHDNSASTTIEVEQSNSVSNKWSGTLSASYTFAKVLEISGKGRIETSTKTTTSVGNEIKAISNLNKATSVGDVTKINYDVHWLQKVDGLDNWWIPEKANDQNVWCVTYEVTEYDTLTVGGKLQITDVEEDEVGLPENFELTQNFPNPFNPSTEIKYSLPERSYVKLEIINLVGEVVKTLVSSNMERGTHNIKWNANNLASGVYIINISSVGLETSQNFRSTKKALLLK